MQIEQSVEVLLQKKTVVISEFYDLFLNRHPEIAKQFEGINVHHQATMLTMALMMVEAFYSHNYPAAEHYLKVLGSRHRHYGAAIEDFPKFRDCLLETLASIHGDGWDEELATQWREAIDKATSTMALGYEEEYIF